MLSAIFNAIAGGLEIAATWFRRANSKDMIANKKAETDQADVDQATVDVKKGDPGTVAKDIET